MTTLESLYVTARDALAVALDGSRSVGFVNFPNHGNPGDPAIWLGTQRLLADLGVSVDYSSAWWNFDADNARRAVGDAPILLNGGGNFGDLYAGQQGARKTVLRTMSGNRVIQMPQSIHFKDPARVEEMRGLIDAHGGFTMMTRERRSEAIARDEFGMEPILSPDHALALGAAPPPVEPASDVVWIGRQPGDPEFLASAAPPPEAGLASFEWMNGVLADQATWDEEGLAALARNAALVALHTAGQPVPEAEQRDAASTFEPLARRWVAYGMRTLAAGRFVVTDKLHGHIFCALMGLPHVVLDNSYGKVSGTLDAWTGGLPGVHRARDGADAWRLAQELLAARA